MKRRTEETYIYYENDEIKSIYEKDNILKKSKWAVAYDWFGSIIIAVLSIFIIFTYLFRVVSVSGESMVPTLNDKDWLVVSNLNYSPKHGDIVVVAKSEKYKDPIIKRVIGLPGECIDIDFKKGIVYRNGVIIQEDYVNTPTNVQYDVEFPVTVPEGCVFVMGDNRNDSLDSRSSLIGMIDSRYILGKVIVRLWPIGEFEV